MGKDADFPVERTGQRSLETRDTVDRDPDPVRVGALDAPTIRS
jgi:hypothetical protein